MPQSFVPGMGDGTSRDRISSNSSSGLDGNMDAVLSSELELEFADVEAIGCCSVCEELEISSEICPRG